MKKINRLVVSLLEGLYVMYMFIIFKTCYSLEIGRLHGAQITKRVNKITDIDLSEYLFHPVIKCETPQSQICLFGKYGSVLIFLYLILREFVSFPKNTNVIVFILILGLCMLNYNAVMYMVPIILVELYLGRNKLKNLFPRTI